MSRVEATLPAPSLQMFQRARDSRRHTGSPHRHRHAPWALPQLASCPLSPCSSWPPRLRLLPGRGHAVRGHDRVHLAVPAARGGRGAAAGWLPARTHRRLLRCLPPRRIPVGCRRREAERRAAYATCSATRFSSASPSTPPASPRSSENAFAAATVEAATLFADACRGEGVTPPGAFLPSRTMIEEPSALLRQVPVHVLVAMLLSLRAFVVYNRIWRTSSSCG